MICMIELGELEGQHAEFDRRRVRIVAVSNDDLSATAQTQAKFPHLVMVSDRKQVLAKAAGTIHAGVAPDGSDTNAPTTILTDVSGKVLWLFRPDRFIERLSPKQLLAAIDSHLR